VRVLIVEDEPAILRVIERALKKKHEVVFAGTAALALGTIASAPPDLAIVDVGLPDLDGVELAKQIRAAVPNVGVIVMSGGVVPIDQLPERGVALKKPFMLAELDAAIEKATKS
jgi:two-component system KDP operon response regulator KdpE